MASFPMQGGSTFPDGTSVSVYVRPVLPFSGAPSGSVVTTGTVTGGAVTFTGLTDGVPYVAYAQVSGQDRYRNFVTEPSQAGVELGYAEITANFASGTNAATDVPGLSITVTEGSRPYTLEAFCYELAGSVLNQFSFMQIVEGSTVLALGAVYVSAVVSTGQNCKAQVRIPAPASAGTVRTFKVQTLASGANNPTLLAAATGKAYLQAVQV